MQLRLYIKFLILYLVFLVFGVVFYLALFRPSVLYLSQVNQFPKDVTRDLLRFGRLLLASIDIVSGLFPVAFFYLCHRPLQDTLDLSEYLLGRGPYIQPSKVTTTDFQKLQANLNYISEEASQAMELQQQTLMNISHDFRSPLTSIKGYTEAILDGTISHTDQDRYLQIISRTTEQLRRLADDILSVGILTGGRSFKLYMTVFDLNEQITAIASTIRLRCEQRELHLVLDLADNLPPVHADLERIKQVILNLLDNAVKFSHSGKDLIVRTWAENGLVYTSIKNYGDGIPAADLAKIWNRYYKGDPSTGTTGTGVGLTIVRQILNMHKQNITVTSSPADGTEFIFTLSAGDRSAL